MTIGHISTSYFSLIIAPFHWSHFSHHGFRPMRLSDQIAFVFPLSHLSTYLNLYPHETASKAHSLLVIWIPPFYFQVFPLFSIFNFSFSRRLLHQHTNISHLKNKKQRLSPTPALFQLLPHFSVPLHNKSS